jgi:ribose transport system substrate-binding protein
MPSTAAARAGKPIGFSEISNRDRHEEAAGHNIHRWRQERASNCAAATGNAAINHCTYLIHSGGVFMNRKLWQSLVIVMLVAGMLAGCGAPAATPTSAPAQPTSASAQAQQPAQPEQPTAAPAQPAQPAAGDKLYVEALALLNLPYFIDHRVGLEFAGKVLDAKTKFVGPVEYDMTAMVNTMEQAMAENPSGMNVIGFDAALKPAIDKIVDGGTPLVTLDAEVYGSKRNTFLGTGNYNAGRVGAKLLADAIGGKGKVALITKVGQSNLEERVKGYQDEFAANFPDIAVVQVINDDSDSAKAADGLKAVLQREPDLAGVGCVEAAGGVGAATASKELGLTDKLKIVSMDRDDGTLKFIEDGVITASVAQKTALMSYLGAKLLYLYNHAPLPIVADNKAAGIIPMPESVDTGTIVINKDNAKYFYHQ